MYVFNLLSSDVIRINLITIYSHAGYRVYWSKWVVKSFEHFHFPVIPLAFADTAIMSMAVKINITFFIIPIIIILFCTRFHFLPRKVMKKHTKSPRRHGGNDGRGRKCETGFYVLGGVILPKVISLRILESICGVTPTNEASSFSGTSWTMPGQRRSNDR